MDFRDPDSGGIADRKPAVPENVWRCSGASVFQITERAEYRARYPALFFVLKKSDLFLGTVAEIGNGCGNLIYLKA